MTDFDYQRVAQRAVAEAREGTRREEETAARSKCIAQLWQYWRYWAAAIYLGLVEQVRHEALTAEELARVKSALAKAAVAQATEKAAADLFPFVSGKGTSTSAQKVGLKMTDAEHLGFGGRVRVAHAEALWLHPVLQELIKRGLLESIRAMRPKKRILFWRLPTDDPWLD